ncbi:YchJ family protein [Enemella sp. A6]|uniref:YchJ family protein n=1 Tax=Enemella sp. A6 TaxID=3440152 RepID=UPI003EBB0D46
MTTPHPCPCDTLRAYPDCCERFHQGRPAPMAVTLMRSRYSAFALGLEQYLLDTWHPSTRPDRIDLDTNTVWTGLTIEHTEAGKAWDTEGIVQFSATWCSPADEGVLRERSRFTMVDQRWYYVGGLHSTSS